jgi:hypothetical protein
MKLLIAIILAATLIGFGVGFLVGSSTVTDERDQCREITHDLSLSRDQVRLSDGRWCAV